MAICLAIEKRYQMKFFGDRDGQGSCSFSGSAGTDIQHGEDREDVEEPDGTRDTQAFHTSQETVMGWRI